MSDPYNIPISLPSTGEEEWQALKEPLMTGWLRYTANVVNRSQIASTALCLLPD